MRLLTHTKSWHPILKDLHWLPVSHRTNYEILVFTFKALHQLAPSYLTDLLTPYQPSRPLRSISASLLSTPKSNLRSSGDRAFSRAASRLWNSAKTSETQSPTQFSHLKTHLFYTAFSKPPPPSTRVSVLYVCCLFYYHRLEKPYINHIYYYYYYYYYYYR